MNNRLNRYLDDLESRLRFLPDADREQEMAEISQHLDALIRAHEANGQSEDAAVQAALAEFGAAREIGSRLYHTGKHKRFAPLREVALFSAAFSVLFWLAGQVLRRLLAQIFYPFPVARIFETRLTHWPLTSWPIGWSIGIAAFAVLALHYSGRGVVQKAREQTPAGAAVRWLFFVQCAGLVPLGFFLHGYYGDPSAHHFSVVQQTVLNGLANALSLLTVFAAAYFVGRGSKWRESVADAVVCAIGVETVVGLFQMLFQFVPTPWAHDAPSPIMSNAANYLYGFSVAVAYGIVCAFVAWLGVQAGEKARRPNLLLGEKQSA